MPPQCFNIVIVDINVKIKDTPATVVMREKGTPRKVCWLPVRRSDLEGFQYEADNGNASTGITSYRDVSNIIGYQCFELSRISPV